MRSVRFILPLLLALAGCSNNPYPAGETARSVAYFALPDDPKSLDPQIAYDSAIAITSVVYPAYLQYHYLKRQPFAMELALGAAMPRREPYRYRVTEKGRRVEKQGESWTFRIKRGLRFQDDPCFPGGKGREITAADFLYSFRRMADPAVPCPIVEYFADKILGYAEYQAGNRARSKRGEGIDDRAPVAGLQADPADPYTFRILLNQPYPQLRYLMALPFTSPLAREAIARYGKEFARHPVGCGPYMLTEYARKQHLILRANPNRYAEFYPTEGDPGDREAGLLRDAGKRLPLAETVVYTISREGVTKWNLFLQGYLDAWAVTQENYQQVMSQPGQLSAEMARKGMRLRREGGVSITYFAFNMRDALVGGYTPRKCKLRQAISLAVDARAFIDLLSAGVGQPADFLVPPLLFGYEPSYRNPYRQYSVERAKQLLAEAGYPGGIDRVTGERLSIYFDNTGTDAAGRQFAGLLMKQLEVIGVRVISRAWRVPVWHDRIDKGQFQLARGGWWPDYPDAENFVFMLYGPNRSPGPNFACYDNPAYNRLFEQMRPMVDGPERLALIRQMRAIAVEECPWIYLQHTEDFSLTHEWLRNVISNPLVWNHDKYVGVDGPRRARLQAEWNQPNYWPAIVMAGLFLLGSLPAAVTVRRHGRRRARKPGDGPP
jgi:oligopeptide transport system substrate-binding protein